MGGGLKSKTPTDLCVMTNQSDQGIPYSRREGYFLRLKVALYSQIGGKSGSFWKILVVSE